MAEQLRPRCDECRHWRKYESGDEAGSGECRRYPPRVVLVELARFGSENADAYGFNAMNGPEWPQTAPHAWCGEYAAAAPEIPFNLENINRQRAGYGLAPLTPEDLVRR